VLNSSGGFTTPTAHSSSASSDKTPSYSPTPVTSSSSKRPSNNSIFFLGDEESSSLSPRSASYFIDTPNSLSEDGLSPLFQQEYSSPPQINSPKRLPSNSSSSSSSQQHSPAIVRTAPLYISVYSTTPPTPLVKGRSPSPSILKKPEQPKNIIKHVRTSSMQHPPNLNLQPQSPSSIVYKYHHYPTTSSSKEQQK
jgi:hypothetical protein